MEAGKELMEKLCTQTRGRRPDGFVSEFLVVAE